MLTSQCGVTRLTGVAFMAKSSKAKHVCFKTLYISEPSHGRNHEKPQRTHKESKRSHFGIFSVANRSYFKLFLITYKVNGSSRNLTPRLGGLPHLPGVSHLHVNSPSIAVTVVKIYKSNRAKHRMYTRGLCTSEYFLATTTYFECFICTRILFSSHSRIYNNIHRF